MKLELKHLAPYLPYRLKVKTDSFGAHIVSGYRTTNHGISILTNDTHIGFLTELTPILRPLSDLHKPINGIVPANYLYREYDVTDLLFNGGAENPKYGYEVYAFLIEHHFDVFGLIEAGLAIDINTIDN